MSERHEIRHELEPGVERLQVRALERVAHRLEDERPVPRAAFRGDLRRHLEVLGPAATRWRPARLRLQVATYVASGVALLAVAGLGLAGAGPFAA